MPFINLIQEQRLAIRRDETRARAFLYAFAGVAGVSVLATSGLFIQSESLKAEENRIKVELQKIKPLNEQIAKINDTYSELNPRVKTLQDAQTITQRWNNILTHLTTQTPAKIWLTAVRCQASDPEKPVTISFTGVADAQEPVGEFILRLQNLDDLENVQLRFTQEKIAASFKGTEFQLDTDIKDSVEKKKDEVKKEGEVKS